jgi:hypothetical protein
VDPHWCVLETGGLPAGFGSPGLWKSSGSGVKASCVFALPRSVWDSAATQEISFDDEATVLDQIFQWAIGTAGGSLAAGWEAPSRPEVESWFKPDQLTVVAGSLLRQGEVVCEPGQLAIRFPLTPEYPRDTPESRLAWLHILIPEARDRWPLVRTAVVIDGNGSTTAIAEVDLTGAPRAIAEDLFVLSLEALRGVVSWLGETTDWLADATVASELLASCPNNQPQESP